MGYFVEITIINSESPSYPNGRIIFINTDQINFFEKGKNSYFLNWADSMFWEISTSDGERLMQIIGSHLITAKRD
jgi:hypothetical protein